MTGSALHSGLYLAFKTREELDEQYDTSRQVPDLSELMRQRNAWSEAARSELRHERDICYGPSPEEKLDIFSAAGRNAPVVVFIHGGYWSTPALTKDLYSWTALGLRVHGFTTVVIDYGVCPDRTISDLVKQCQNVIVWLQANAESYGSSASKIYVTGHSAGGHLAAMLALTDWSGKFGLPGNIVKGICPISGLFDLRPFPHTWLNPRLQLTPEEIHCNSPLFLLKTPSARMLIAYGENETPEFHRQAREMYKGCLASGTTATLFPIAGSLHNSAIDGLKNSNSQLCNAIAQHAVEAIEFHG